MSSWTKVWWVTSKTQRSSCGVGRQLAEDEQVGDLEVARLLAELLDRVAPVLEDPGLAVDVGDRRAAGGGVGERRVVGHQAEVVLGDLDLAQVHRPHRAVGDRQLVGLAGAVVGDRQRPRRCAPPPPRSRPRSGPRSPSPLLKSRFVGRPILAANGREVAGSALNGGLLEVREALEGREALVDLALGEAAHALGAEVLDVEGGQHRSVAPSPGARSARRASPPTLTASR